MISLDRVPAPTSVRIHHYERRDTLGHVLDGLAGDSEDFLASFAGQPDGEFASECSRWFGFHEEDARYDEGKVECGSVGHDAQSRKSMAQTSFRSLNEGYL